MINKKVNILIAFFLMAIFILPQIVHAAYEPSEIWVEGISTGLKPQMVPVTDLVTTIKASSTALPKGGSFLRYVYKWNNSNSPLTAEELHPMMESQVPYADPITFTTDRNLFAASNYDNNPVWYLHVKTVYTTPGTGLNISDDKVVGPFTFDNIPPTGTIALAAVDGQPGDSTTTLTPVVLTVGAEPDTAKIYINISEEFTTATILNADSSNTVKYPISGSGVKTLYAWFQDEAGNVTAKSDYFPLTFTVLSGKSMDPAGDLALGVGKARVFAVNGAGADTFNWSIVNSAGAPAGGAKFSGGSKGVSTVTVKGVTEDAEVYVKAESIPAGTTYTSGIITIVKSGPVFNYDVDGNGKYQTLKDGIIILRYIAGLSGNSLIADALAEDATRKDPQEIIDYLNTGKEAGAIDVDGNGKYQTLKDGIILLRFIAGLSGNSLIADALAEDATRKDPDALKIYMDTFKQ